MKKLFYATLFVLLVAAAVTWPFLAQPAGNWTIAPDSGIATAADVIAGVLVLALLLLGVVVELRSEVIRHRP